ncbi:MAG: hypothetical protein NTX15_02080 [Candidatus Kapabacteria bacterium]|nr:hypothetical protein [Candidatus Kapabacteria bacterium]
MARILFILSLCIVAHPLLGQNWRLLHPVLSHTVVINPQNPQVLYIGNWANQMYRSDDGGKSWTLLELGNTSATNFISSVVASSLDTNVLLAGGFGFDGISRSVDRGKSWKRALNDVNNARMWFISEAIIEDNSRPGVFYGARGSTNNGVWESTNNGLTWDSIAVIPSSVTTSLCTIAQRRDSSNIFFLGCEGGVIMRSDDRCRTWRQVPVLRGGLRIKLDSEIPKIVFSVRYPLQGYAPVAISDPSGISDNGGILMTTDGGATWDRMAFADTSFWACDTREGLDGKDDIFIGGFRTSNRPTAIKGDSLVFRSSNGGGIWSRYENIPWGQNDIGDTIRNVWILRYEPVLKRMYMAAETGLFVLDEATSINDQPAVASHETLKISTSPEMLTVSDLDANDDHTTWTMYSMTGVRIAGGAVTNPEVQLISTASLASGAYLLTWGSERRFRTAQIMITR